MKVGETTCFEFSKPCYVMASCVHTHHEYFNQTINAKDAEGVRGPKGAGTIKATQECPFIMTSGSEKAIYKRFSDKTHGMINGAAIKVEGLLTFKPLMVNRNEFNGKRVNIGIKENCRQWKLVLIPITEEEFNDIKSTPEPYHVSFGQVQRRIYEKPVQFVREIRDRDAKKVLRPDGAIRFPDTPYQWGPQRQVRPQQSQIRCQQSQARPSLPQVRPQQVQAQIQQGQAQPQQGQAQPQQSQAQPQQGQIQPQQGQAQPQSTAKNVDPERQAFLKRTASIMAKVMALKNEDRHACLDYFEVFVNREVYKYKGSQQ